MPTPSETTLPPSPSSELPSRASFASCPPDEDRNHNAPSEERLDGDLEEGEPSSAVAEEEAVDQHAIAQQPTPEPESEPRAPENEVLQEAQDKAEHVEHDEDGVESPSPVASPEAQAEPQFPRSAQQTSNYGAPNEPLYLPYSSDPHRLLPNSTSSFLRPGSKFHGTQQSDRQVYDVQVEIKDVDMTESFLCGYLRIQGLTDDHPTLTTFFEGEIIGPKHLFKTAHPSWGSTEKIDLQHWARFPAWRPLARSASKSASFTLKNYQQREHLFMRWKEYFLVPDHRVKSISGASFEGFYYICFDQRLGNVSGIYFHAKSEKYQQLELKHVRDGGCMTAMEFR